MANCIKLPDFPALPDLGGLSFPLPPGVGLDLSVDYCCKLALFASVTIPPEVKAAIKTALMALPDVSPTILLINQQIALLNAYKNALPLRCPFDDQAGD